MPTIDKGRTVDDVRADDALSALAVLAVTVLAALGQVPAEPALYVIAGAAGLSTARETARAVRTKRRE